MSASAPLPSAVEALLTRAESLLARLEQVLPHPATPPDWGAAIAWRYVRRGQAGVLEPVRQVARIRLADLKEIEPQKERLVRNTEQFVAGRMANNVLLTGARGTGKSSLIKACLNEYAPRGLRLVEIDKADLPRWRQSHEVITHRFRAGRTVIHVLSESRPDDGFEPIEGSLEDLYFATLASRRKPIA